MRVIIRLTAKEEARALPILLRHSPGAILPDRTYVLSEEAAKAPGPPGSISLRSAARRAHDLTDWMAPCPF
jgi:hypothetical protein